eukprot:TRINITY_DN47188_c0_g1_i1.p1 TRINITY_DN47188_c0_g1~~TRINITY_DN47188_c0_g1_i1.p1  ORF type:complete len:432 (+),score=26.12 TRINITY_DN47188_c0_g1_i1:77-1372(+)
MLLAIVVVMSGWHCCTGSRIESTSETDPQVSRLHFDDMRVKLGCSSLAQEQIKEISDESGSKDYVIAYGELQRYFQASGESIDAFLTAIGLDGSRDLSCKSLLSKSLVYVQTSMSLKVTDQVGLYCETWARDEHADGTAASETCTKWIDLSDTNIERIAKGLTQYRLDARATNSTEIEAADTLDVEASDAVQAQPQYSVRELALIVVQNFQVFPSSPQESALPSSLLERDDPKFQGRFDSSRQDTLRGIIAKAHAWVLHALKILPRALVLIRKWFGTDSNYMIEKVRHTLLQISRVLNRLYVKKGSKTRCESKKGLAYVKRKSFLGRGVKFTTQMHHGRYVINLCKRFWDPDNIGHDFEPYGLLITKASLHTGTRERLANGILPHGYDNCLNIAKKSPGAAMQNGENYMWMIFELNKKRVTQAQEQADKAE